MGQINLNNFVPFVKFKLSCCIKNVSKINCCYGNLGRKKWGNYFKYRFGGIVEP